MRWLIRILSALFLILLILVAIVFMVANSQPHELKFLDWHLAQADVGVWITISFVIGIVLGFVVGVAPIFGLRRQNKRMQKKLTEKQATLEPVT